MYTSEKLSRFPFFREVLESTPLASIHDSLTGLIARPYIMRFIQSLIAEQTPFAMAMVDLDNFKSINDNYGHRTGDAMLSNVANSLTRYVGKQGVVGRYGGDEFLMVVFGKTDYDSMHAFLDAMYFDGDVFRRDRLINGRTIYSTATIGCAIYPKDADSFDGLFALVDKTLYRGKSKGRNCFILYVPAKHAHLEIPALAHRSLYDTIVKMADGFDRGTNLLDKLWLAFLPMKDNLRIFRVFFIDEEKRLYDPLQGELVQVETVSELIQRGLYTAHSLEELEQKCPILSQTLNEMGFDSVMISEAAHHGRVYGWLVFCPEVHNLHIWQEGECTAAYFLSRMLAEHLEGHS